MINFYCPFGPPPLILSLACDTILIISQEALFCYPHRLHLFHSPQHSWGIRLFIHHHWDGYYHYKDWIAETGRNSAVQKRNAAVLLRKDGRLASQYAAICNSDKVLHLLRKRWITHRLSIPANSCDNHSNPSELRRKRTIASTCSYASFSAIIVSHDTESKKLST